MPDNVWAVDARTGHQIWHYTYPANKGLHIGQRGVGAYKGSIYFMTPDAHLVSLDGKTGAVRWNVEVADVCQGLLDHDVSVRGGESPHRRSLRATSITCADF